MRTRTREDVVERVAEATRRSDEAEELYMAHELARLRSDPKSVAYAIHDAAAAIASCEGRHQRRVRDAWLLVLAETSGE